MRNDTLLITGGAGFLGTHLIQKLIKNGFSKIIVLDKRKPSIEEVEYVYGDFADESIMPHLLKKCGALVHLAAIVGVDNCRDHPELVTQVNLIDTKKLINMSTAMQVKRILFTSSSEVYGNSKDIPYSEESKVTPVSLYGETKAEVEEYLWEIQKKCSTTVGIVRPFNVYGPGQRADFVVPAFIDRAMHNKPIQIFGNGMQTRTFTYVEDVAESIVKLYDYDKTPYEIINVGSKEEYTIKALAETIKDALPQSISEIEFMEYGADGVRSVDLEIDRRVPSIEKAKKLLSFEAKTSLPEGIEEIIKQKTKQI